jgi:predicted phage terminase large subunit-like protein
MFKAKTSVAVEYFRIGGVKLTERIEQEVRARQVRFSVMDISIPGLMSLWSRKGLLTQYDSPESAHYPASTRLAGYWTPINALTLSMAYNADHIPIKPQDAQSEAIRNKTIQWYENTLLSRLDDKVRGAIVLLMQRLHLDDLAGHLLEKRGFEHLCLPAIAEQPATIALGHGRVHIRKVDDVLDPVREPLWALNKVRADMTPLQFSAQYQQRPIPLEGNIIKREWLHYFTGTISRAPGDYFVISWDTAMKSSELCDYSVGTVWHVQGRGRKKNLVDVVRGRYEYPDLVAQAIALWRKWKFEGYTTHLVVEDKGSGSSLIQSLKNERIYVSPCKLKLEGDKVMRLTAEAAEFHSGSVNLREDARWVGELVAELLGFPGARHDDQVDSVSQALAFMGWLDAHRGSSEELRI